MKSAIEVVRHHSSVMRSKDINIILDDFASDAIVITNLLEEPVVGHDNIKKLIDAEVHKRNEKKDVPHSEILLQKDYGGYVLHVFKNEQRNILGIETFVVENEKIIFESSYITKLNK